MAVSCECVVPLIYLIRRKERLADALAKRDVEAVKDIAKDTLETIRDVERYCRIPPVSEHIKGHLVKAKETGAEYEAEEGVNDAINEVLDKLYDYCRLAP
jgi:hypothetical protein